MTSALIRENFADAGKNAALQFSNLVQSASSKDIAVGSAFAKCVVYVAGGLHRGAVLKRADITRIGSAEDNDVILRDPGVRSHHAELRRVDGIWEMLDIASGKSLNSIETVSKGRFVRKLFGVGAAEIICSQLQPAVAARRKFKLTLARSAAPILLFLSAILGAVVIVQLVQPASANLPSGVRNLAAEGFPDVNLTSIKGNQPQVEGYVNDAESLAKLRRWIDRSNFGATTFQVRVGNELAARVREALAEPTLTVAYQSKGTVKVQGSSNDLALRERLNRLIADLNGVVKIDNRVAFNQVVDNSPREYPLPIKITDIRPGVNGSFGNGSGGRYFVGAVLPDGAEVVAIKADSIDFLVAGRVISYPVK